jgi:hypothetical protein
MGGGTNMLSVVPKAWSYTFSVLDGTESVAQAVELSWWGDKGELRIQGVTYTARSGESCYILESASGVLARAERPRKLFRELVVEHSGHRYRLRERSVFRREFVLFEGSRERGSISPEGLFTRKAAVTLPKAFPLFLQVFVIWLAMMLWKHEEPPAPAAIARTAS